MNFFFMLKPRLQIKIYNIFTLTQKLHYYTNSSFIKYKMMCREIYWLYAAILLWCQVCLRQRTCSNETPCTFPCQRSARPPPKAGECVTLWRTVVVKLMPPLSFFLKPMLGGFLLRRMPKPSSSCSISFLCPRGFRTSRTIRIRLQVRATETQTKNNERDRNEREQAKAWCVCTQSLLSLPAITCLPLPLPSLAPSMIPGRSKSWNTQQARRQHQRHNFKLFKYYLKKKKKLPNI